MLPKLILSKSVQDTILRFVSISLLSVSTTAIPLSQFSLAAEQLSTSIDGVELAVPLDDVEQFAKTGEISTRFAPFAQALDQPTRDRFQRILLERVTVDPTQLERLVGTPLMSPLFESLGKTFQTPSGANGETDIRVAVDKAAADPNAGLTLLNVMRQFPDDSIRVDLPSLIQLMAELEALTEYREAAVNAVTQEAAQEAGGSASKLPDLRTISSHTVEKQSHTFTIPHPRLTDQGLVSSYEMPVDFYLPQVERPVPLIVMSHGFGATRINYAYLAEYLASHGFAVAALEHIASDLPYRQEFLEGELTDLIQPSVYIYRSRDITYLLDALEGLDPQDQPWAARIDLQSIGVMGNSLGGTTALSVAGAAFNPARLRQDCTPDRVIVSVSYLLQCIAKNAPFGQFNSARSNLGDSRIKAVLAAYPLTSSLFGSEGMAQITVPTLIMAGSEDFIAPVAQDQIQPFTWLKTTHKYLALLTPGTHFSSSDDAYVQGFPPALLGPSTALGREYLEILSVAFFGSYLGNAESRTVYRPYLNAGYAQTISQEPLQLHLIRSLTPTQLEQAYGRPLPSPIIPLPLTESVNP